MHVETIPRPEWGTFLQAFSAQHRDWLAHVRLTEHAGLADADAVPLRDVRVGERAGGASTITVEAGTVTHTLAAPRRVRVHRREDGADVLLEVEGAGGTKLSLKFPVTQPAEAVDGCFEKTATPSDHRER